MKVYKVELLIVDHDQLGPTEIQDVIENIKYPNHCMYPRVMAIDGVDIGEGYDAHALNRGRTDRTMRETYARLFP